MNTKVEITVDYYKQSGKWYTEETYEIELPTVMEDGPQGWAAYTIRRELKSIISQAFTGSELIAVVRYTEDVGDVIEFPMMVR